MELERIGLRNCSLPFDWVISGDFIQVLNLIDNGFVGFADRKNLYQETEINPAYYYDKGSKIHFFHDFSPYKSFDEQYEGFESKYIRRINRFYETIKQPTIFMRYCHNIDELKYISDNMDDILSLIRRFNSQNRIIFITSFENDFNIDDLYYVEKDVGETVAKRFFEKLPELQSYLISNSALNSEIQNNLKIYKRTKRKRLVSKIYKKIMRIFRKKIYVHRLQYKQLEGET